MVFAGGSYNRFWTSLVPDSKLKTSRPVQGAYFQFDNVKWEMDSFSLTLDGDNLIWSKPFKRLLVGSTSMETNHLFPPFDELKAIYQRISQSIDLEIPPMVQGEVKVGLREKAQKREPYLFEEGHKIFFGGLYQNGYSLGLQMAQDLSRQFL